MSGFSGTVTTTNQAWFSIRESNYGSENADFVINSTGTGDQVTGILLDNINTTADNPVKFGSISGNGWIRPMGNQGKDFYIEVGGTNTNASFSGLIPTHNNDSVYITKVGTGNWTLSSSGLDLKRPLTIKEGTVTIGNGANDGKLSDTTQVIVEENGTLQYSRTAYNYTIDRNESILLKGGTLKNIGPQKFTYTHLTVENAGTLRSTTETTLKDLVLTGEAEDARFTIDGSGSKVYMTGSITGGDNQEIYFTSVRGNFMYIQCDDVSGFSGTITAGPATNTTLGTWISLNGATTDFSTVTLNPNPGKIKEGADAGKSIDSGILLEFDPTGKTLQVGAISGDGIFRSNGQAGKTFTIQTGAKNIDTTFSGSFSRYENSNYAIEKVGTGTWTITSDYEPYYASSPIGNSYKNNYTGNTTITEGTIQIGDGGEVGHLGAGNDPSKMTKIIIGEEGTLAINRTGAFTFYNNIESAGKVAVVSAEEGDSTKLAGTVTGTLEKTGEGTLLVTGNNLTGVTKFTVTEGKLQFGNGEASNTCGYTSNARSFEIGEGGTLAFNYVIPAGADLSLSGNLTSNGGTIEVDGDPAGHVALRGAVNGSFIKTGTGALAMGSSNGANLTKITIKEGILRNYAADRLGNGATEIVMDGGIFSEQNAVTLGNKFTVLSDSRFENPLDVILTHDKGFTGTDVVLTKTGAGKLIISGGAELSGGYIIDGGTIQCGNNDNGHINNNAFVTVNSGAAFGYKRAANASTVKPTNVVTVDGGKLFNSGARKIEFQDVTMKAGGLTLENTGTSTLTANVKSTENGVLRFNGTTDGDITANVNGSAAAQTFGGLASANDVKSTINFTSSNRGNFMNLNGSMSTFSGDINISGNCWFAFNSGNALGSEKASFNLSMTKDCGLLIESGNLDGKTIQMGDLTGTGWVRAGNGGRNVTLEIGALGNDSTFSGSLINY
ncbi:MAG: autotransporter-associated beta strand repeat-containing protein, partial [Thermoguttaceae bacterium]|nr:autotransporter-associated beta strand repeat-containing protein [Thermoguttaceae bacterium]